MKRWKVVFWREGDGEYVRQVFGKRVAADAWSLWWNLYYLPHALEVELWRGNVRVMRTTAERWRD